MRQQTDKLALRRHGGFTLIELMICMAIIGLTLGLGLQFLHSGENALAKAGKLLQFCFSRARADAMLSGRKIMLAIENNTIFEKKNGQARQAQKFPDDVKLLSCLGVNGKKGKCELFFEASGIAGENLLILGNENGAITVYLPPVGHPLVLNGEYSLQTARKEIQ